MFYLLLSLCFFSLFNVAVISAVNHTVYNQTNAYRSLYFAYGAYCNSTHIRTWTCKWCAYVPGFQVQTVIDLDDLLAFVGFDTVDNQIIVSFRGTHNVVDWLDDLDTVTTPYPDVFGGIVHQGFYDAWTYMLYSNVMSAVSTLMSAHKNVNVLITGHSLGGALTQLAALSIYNYAKEINNNISIICYTFGSPRWGNEIMANYFNARISVNWRLTNVKDVVPTVPPYVLLFYHTHTNIWYTKDSPLAYTKCSSTNGEDPACMYIGYSIDDHLNYLNLYESC